MPKKIYTRDMMPLDTPAIDRDVAIKKTLAAFEFKHVQRVLKTLDGSAPSIAEMQAEAAKILTQAFDTYPQPEPSQFTWNGFQAWRSPGTKDHYCTSGSLNLRFVLDEVREFPEPEDPKKSRKSAVIASLMERFNFERVHKAISLRKREAWEGEPWKVEQMKASVQQMLEDVWKKYPSELCISSGGFNVWRSPGVVDVFKYPKGLELCFVLASEWTDLTPPEK